MKNRSMELFLKIKNVETLFVFRYMILISSFIAFFLKENNKNQISRIIISCGIIISSILITFLYRSNKDNKELMKLLIFIETIGNCSILIASGGFESPFIWYFVCSLLIAFLKVGYKPAVCAAFAYFLCACITSILYLQANPSRTTAALYVNMATSFFIVVYGMYKLRQFVFLKEQKNKELVKMNISLEEERRRAEGNLKICLEIYEAVSIYQLEGKKEVFAAVLEYLHRLFLADKSVLVRINSINELKNSKGISVEEAEIQKLVTIVLETETNDIIGKIKLLNEDEIQVFYAIGLDDDSNGYGVYIYSYLKDENFERKKNQINYDRMLPFAQLAGIILKKIDYQDILEDLIISEEQNRIANEIHDIVLQKLFAISCKLYLMCSNTYNQSIDECKLELKELQSAIDHTRKELRETIYGKSWNGLAGDMLRISILNYVDEVKKLQQINIETSIIGESRYLHANQKTLIYRMVCESINNAVRHGKAKNIKVTLMIESDKVKLLVEDDGEGFNLDDLKERNQLGLGLNNLYRSTTLLNGNIRMKSESKMGTSICIEFPYNV